MDNFLRKDWVLRIIAIIMAIVVWAEVSGSSDPIVSRTYAGLPIAVVGEAPGQVARLDPSVGTVVVAGPQTVMNTFSRAAVVLSVDVGGLAPGTHRLPIRVRLPAGTAVTMLAPGSTVVTILPRASFRRQVEITSVGTPAVGSYVADIVYRPSVTISGPRQYVRRVVAARAAVSVAGADRSFIQYVHLTPVDGRGQPVAGVTAEPAVIAVQVLIRSYPSRKVTVVAEAKGVPANGYRVVGITVTPRTVTLYGPAASLASIRSVAIPPIAVSGFSTGFTRTLPLPLPPGIMAAPSVVSVTVDIAPKQP